MEKGKRASEKASKKKGERREEGRGKKYIGRSKKDRESDKT